MEGRRPYKKRDAKITSAIMRTIRRRENRAELMLRKALWNRGLRYRLYDASLIGKPDLVFVSARVVVFVDGDYWHGRALRERGVDGLRGLIRGDRYAYWKNRFEKNIRRDERVTLALRSMGWTVIRLWESEVLADVDGVAKRVTRMIRDAVCLRSWAPSKKKVRAEGNQLD